MSKNMIRPTYDVYLDNPDGEPTHHEVQVRYCDQMRAELEAGKNGLPPMSRSTAQNHTTVWVWCAMVRLGLYKAPFQQFLAEDVVDIQGRGRAAETGDPEGEVVDPTQPAAPAGTPSSSPLVSVEDRITGSTQTSTSA